LLAIQSAAHDQRVGPEPASVRTAATVRRSGRDTGASVTGQVRDDTGAPVVRALVEATTSLADAWSDKEGRFELRRLPFGTLHFQVRALSAVAPIEFFVDRPFLFALRDEKTGTLLFVGYIAGPRE